MAEHKLRRAGKEVPMPLPPAKAGKEQAAPRDHKGRFKPGVSGNVKGRAQGSRNTSTLLLLEALGKKAPDLLNKMVERAEAGDVLALRFLLERLLPQCKTAPVSVRLSGDPQRDSALLVGLASSGELPTREALELAELVRVQSEIGELAQLRERVEALEGGRLQ